MAPPQTFVIELDGGDKVFSPGDNLTGRVIAQTVDEKKLRGIYLTLKGQGYCHWSETYTTGSGDNQQTHTRYYTDVEPYFDFRVNLWGGSGDSQILPPGRYEFPFSLQLPNVPLPSVTEGFYGHIRYWLEARMDRPWKFDHVTKRAFTILERVDLNKAAEDLTIPRRGENQKTLCCLCCKSGPITVTVSTDRGGYCSGESILVTAHVENLANKNMRGLRAALFRTITYYAQGSRRLGSDKVAEMKTTQPIPAGQTFQWNQQPLPIPPCPPSSHTCRIIHVDYHLSVVLQVPTGSLNMTLNLPVVIGTEPLASVYADSGLPVSRFTAAPAVNIADNRYTMGQTQFAPMYRTLTVAQPSAPPQGGDGVRYESLPPPYPTEAAYPPVGQGQPPNNPLPYPA